MDGKPSRTRTRWMAEAESERSLLQVAERIGTLEQQHTKIVRVPVGPKERVVREQAHLVGMSGRELCGPLHGMRTPSIAVAAAKRVVFTEPTPSKGGVRPGEQDGIA